MIIDNNKISRNIEQAWFDNKYIVTSRVIYQPFYSINAGYYAQPIYKSSVNLIGRGRFVHYTGDQVNNLIGFNHVNNL